MCCAPLASFCTDRRSPLFGQVLLEGPHRLRLRRGRHHHHPLPEELPGRGRRHAVLVAEEEIEGIFSCFKYGFVSVGPLSTAATPQSRYILEPFVLLPELQRIPIPPLFVYRDMRRKSHADVATTAFFYH